MNIQRARWVKRGDMIYLEPARAVETPKRPTNGLTFTQTWLIILSVVVLYIVGW